MAIGWFTLQDEIWPEPPTDLYVSSFDAETVLADTEYTYTADGTGPEDVRENDVAVVSIGLRNRGVAPVFLTHAVLNFQVHETLETCVQFGDVVWASQQIDIDVPLNPASVPWAVDIPISHAVAPNAVDRLDFRLGTEDYVPFLEPSVVSVDIAIKEDDKPEPTPVGTARLVVPAMGARTSLANLSDTAPAELLQGCSTRNLRRMERVLQGPALSRVDSSQVFDDLHQALTEYESGESYDLPERSD